MFEERPKKLTRIPAFKSGLDADNLCSVQYSPVLPHGNPGLGTFLILILCFSHPSSARHAQLPPRALGLGSPGRSEAKHESVL
jgi:hypothetical protein